MKLTVAGVLASISGIGALIALSGCGVVPSKVFIAGDKAVISKKNSIGYPFRLRRSIVLIKHDPKTMAFSAAVSPYELDAEDKYTKTYYIAGLDDMKSTTQLKVTYLDNTKLVDELQVTTKDNIADTINKIGTGVTALVPLLAGSVSGKSKPDAKPFVDTLFDPSSSLAGQWRADEMNPGYCMRQRDVSVEEGIPVAEYMAGRSAVHAVDFPVPACATAVIDIAPCENLKPSAEVASVRVVYSSHTTVTPMPLPSSGKLKMNSACGATVTEADKSERFELMTYLTTLITNVNNIKAAAKKKD